MQTTESMTYGLAFAGYSLESVQEILGISDGRAKKLRDQNLLRPTPDSGKGKRERFVGWDVEYLAAARQRALPVTQPTLVCAMGVEHIAYQVPSMFFDRNDVAHGARVLDSVAEELPAEINQLVADRTYRVTGHWKVSDEDAKRLVEENGIAVASYTGFILDGGRVIAEVPRHRWQGGGRCFIVEPFTGRERTTYCHTYRTPKVGPVVEVVYPE
ncbi:hypothetical protein ACFSSC_11990 [Corynebacterium mendelii]|uniref:Uncharacterized protein n=1 Tax=Corynebacterium mendelii TaxID=2765362 RepID=A0A939E049_9CORY|nr:hypothetical protein [Corynebacterium mendelii]MBN9643037.1 hypothetical protein [Corynebacterium mendelii]